MLCFTSASLYVVYVTVLLFSLYSEAPVLETLVGSSYECGDRRGYHVRPLKEPFFRLFVLEHRKDPRLLCRALTLAFVLILVLLIRLRGSVDIIACKTASTIHEIPKLATPELRTLHAEDKRDGIHEIGLASAIGPNDGREILGWTYDLVPPVE